VILLVVLASMGGILSSFTDTQKEISLHQQLDEESRLSALFLGLHAQRTHGGASYPTNPSNGPATPETIVSVTNAYVRSTGALLLPSVRISGYPQGVPCSIVPNWVSGTVEFKTMASDSGLADEVSAVHGFASPDGFNLTHSFESDGCGSPIILEGN
jgi:hypothetical protein